MGWKYIIGVDPEPTGAAALLKINNKHIIDADVIDTPFTNDMRIDIRNRCHIPLPTTGYALIEKVWAFPGQHAVAMDKLIRSAGAWEALLICKGFDVEVIPPRTWKTEFKLTSDKQLSFDRAKALYLNELGITKLDNKFEISPGILAKNLYNRAEALLIAYFHFLSLCDRGGIL